MLKTPLLAVSAFGKSLGKYNTNDYRITQEDVLLAGNFGLAQAIATFDPQRE